MRPPAEPTFRDKVLDALKRQTLTTEELRLRFGCRARRIGHVISDLWRDGAIERVGFGEYRAVPPPMPHVSEVELAGDGPAAKVWSKLQRRRA